MNASEIITDPFGQLLHPFMGFFETVTGNGMNFWVIPLIGFALAIFVNTDYDPVPVSMFMLVSGALLSSGSIMAGLPGLPFMLIIFAAIGLTGVFVSLYLTNKR